MKYWNSFSDQDFVKKLVTGKKLSIEDLRPNMYKELYNSELKDKIRISLRKG